MYLTRSRPNAGLSIIMAGLLGLLGCLLAFLARSPSPHLPGAVALPLSMFQLAKIPEARQGTLCFDPYVKLEVELRPDGFALRNSLGGHVDIPLRGQLLDWVALTQVLTELHQRDWSTVYVELRVADEIPLHVLIQAVDQVVTAGFANVSVWETKAVPPPPPDQDPRFAKRRR